MGGAGAPLRQGGGDGGAAVRGEGAGGGKAQRRRKGGGDLAQRGRGRGVDVPKLKGDATRRLHQFWDGKAVHEECGTRLCTESCGRKSCACGTKFRPQKMCNAFCVFSRGARGKGCKLDATDARVQPKNAFLRSHSPPAPGRRMCTKNSHEIMCNPAICAQTLPTKIRATI